MAAWLNGETFSANSTETVTYWIGANTSNSLVVGGIAPAGEEPKPEGALDWLDRRIEEMRVKL